VLIVAVDLPLLTTAFLEFLARADENADAVVPVSGGRWQPLCAMYRRRAAPVLDAAIDRGESRSTRPSRAEPDMTTRWRRSIKSTGCSPTSTPDDVVTGARAAAGIGSP
jgi:hypothetical protein